MKNNFLNSLTNIVGKNNVFVKKKDKAAFVVGWRAFEADCEVVITPSTLLEMWNVLNVLHNYKKIILIQASNTSLTGGSTPFGLYDRDLAIISTLKLNKIYLINNAKQIIDYGADILVAGSAVFKAGDPAQTIKNFYSLSK